MKHLFTQHREAINSAFVFQFSGGDNPRDAIGAQLENEKKLAEKSTEAIDNSKNDQVECKKECFENALTAPAEYSKESVNYKKETTEIEIPGSTNIAVPENGKDIKSYDTECTYTWTDASGNDVSVIFKLSDYISTDKNESYSKRFSTGKKLFQAQMKVWSDGKPVKTYENGVVTDDDRKSYPTKNNTLRSKARDVAGTLEVAAEELRKPLVKGVSYIIRKNTDGTISKFPYGDVDGKMSTLCIGNGCKTTNKTNADRVLPGEKIYYSDVAQAFIILPEGSNDENLTLDTTKTEEKVTYYKGETEIKHEDLPQGVASTLVNSDTYTKETYFKVNSDGTKTSVEKNAYDAGMKVQADYQAIKADKALTENLVENKVLQGGEKINNNDIDDLVSGANESIDAHEKDLADVAIYQEVLRTEYGRTFDPKTGIVGLVNAIGKIENTLVEKMEKAGIDKETFKKIYKSEQKSLVMKIADVKNEARKSGLKEKYKMTTEKFEKALDGKFENFDKIKYTSWKEDLVNIGVGVLFEGANVPIIHVNTKREARAQDNDAITKHKNDNGSETKVFSENLSDVVNQQRKATESIRAIASTSAVLQGTLNTDGIKAAYTKLTTASDHFKQNDEKDTDNLHEGMQKFLDAREGREASQAKDQKNVNFRFWERMIGDRKANKEYKRALKILSAENIGDLPRKQAKKWEAYKGNEMNPDVISVKFERFKLEALETIQRLTNAELVEDKLKGGASKKGGEYRNVELDRMVDVRKRTVENMETGLFATEIVENPEDEGKNADKLWKMAVFNLFESYKTADDMALFLDKTNSNQKTILDAADKFYNATTLDAKLVVLKELNSDGNNSFKEDLTSYSSSLKTADTTFRGYIGSLPDAEKSAAKEALADCQENCNIVAYDGKSVRYIKNGKVPVTLSLNYADTSVDKMGEKFYQNLKNLGDGGGVKEISKEMYEALNAAGKDVFSETVKKKLVVNLAQGLAGTGASILTDKIFKDNNGYDAYENIVIDDTKESKDDNIKSDATEKKEGTLENVSLSDIKLALGQNLDSNKMIPLYENFLENNKDHEDYSTIERALSLAKNQLDEIKDTDEIKNNLKEGGKITLAQLTELQGENENLNLRLNGKNLKSLNEADLQLLNISAIKAKRNGTVRKIVFERDMTGVNIYKDLVKTGKGSLTTDEEFSRSVSNLSIADKQTLLSFVEFESRATISKATSPVTREIMLKVLG